MGVQFVVWNEDTNQAMKQQEIINSIPSTVHKSTIFNFVLHKRSTPDPGSTKSCCESKQEILSHIALSTLAFSQTQYASI